VSVTDTDNGRSIRSVNLGGGNRIDLTIAHSESSENKGILSDRYLMRMDRTLVESQTPYAATKVSAYLVVVVPRRPDITPVLTGQTILSLLALLCGTMNPDWTPGEDSLLDSPGLFGRILSGEL